MRVLDWDLPRSLVTVVVGGRKGCGRGERDNNWAGHCMKILVVGCEWGDELKSA